jgi:hypothetical protein
MVELDFVFSLSRQSSVDDDYQSSGTAALLEFAGNGNLAHRTYESVAQAGLHAMEAPL